MLGFEVRYNDKVIYAAIGEEGVLCVFMHYCNPRVAPENNRTCLDIGGLVSFEHLRWCSDNIDDCEQVSIKVVEVKQISEYRSSPQKREELIQSYHSLKKELQKEGLI